MARVNADTSKMIDCGNDVVKKAIECGDILNDVFNSLENINKTAWNGATATKYATLVHEQRVQYQNLVNALINYGNVMKNAGDKLENNIRNYD